MYTSIIAHMFQESLEMKYMAITVRLNDKEQEALRKKCVELNKALINKNLMPIKEIKVYVKKGKIYFIKTQVLLLK